MSGKVSRIRHNPNSMANSLFDDCCYERKTIKQGAVVYRRRLDKEIIAQELDLAEKFETGE